MIDHLVRPMIMRAENLGDATRYTVVLADDGDAILCHTGGDYAPRSGGLFPKHLLDAFEIKIIDWAHGVEREDALRDTIYRWHGYQYMWGKQGSQGHKWDLAVAFIFAWLHMRLASSNDEAAKMIGYIFNNKREEARVCLETVIQILY